MRLTMKAGKSSELVGRLAGALHKVDGGIKGVVIGRDPANDFDKLHHRRRVHEMKADKTFRPVGGGGKPRYGDRRGVGRDHGFCA